MQFLDFELSIQILEDKLKSCKMIGKQSGIDVTVECKNIENKILQTKKKIYNKLTPWQRVQLSRHPNRPYTLDYIYLLCNNTFTEMHGDRYFSDDKALVGGLGIFENRTVMFIGQQKGRSTIERKFRRFGMPNPEGYRKALRLMKLAEKFQITIVTFIDTPGAYPGIEAEERGQGEAIAKNIFEMMSLKVPIIVIIIGEGGSGGALGIGIGNYVFMMENTWYSVISPESCSSILWKNWNYKEEAAKVLKLTPKDMLKFKLIDGIIREPLGGAHYNLESAAIEIKKCLSKAISCLSKKKSLELVKERQNKFIKMGIYKNSNF